MAVLSSSVKTLAGSGSRIPSPPSGLRSVLPTPAVRSSAAGRPPISMTMLAKPRPSGSSRIPSPPSALQRAIPAPAVPSSAAVRPPSSMTRPSRTPSQRPRNGTSPAAPKPAVVAAKIAMSSSKTTTLPVARPDTGKAAATKKPTTARAPTPSPKPKPATVPVAGRSGRPANLTNSSRGLPTTSKTAVKPTTPPKPTSTKPAVSKPKVVPQPPPKKQPATAVPRVAKTVPAIAISLPRPPKVQEKPAPVVVHKEECGGCCTRKNRSSTAPAKSKKVRFAEPLVTRYRCLTKCLCPCQPWGGCAPCNNLARCLRVKEDFEEDRDTTFFWDPSKTETERFRAEFEARVVATAATQALAQAIAEAEVILARAQAFSRAEARAQADAEAYDELCF